MINRKVKITIASSIFILFVFANIYAVRKIMNYGTKLYLYDKLSVAYNIGGITALRSELEAVFLKDKSALELGEARSFRNDLSKINDPGKFLDENVRKYKEKVTLLRNMRSLAFIVILIIFFVKVMLDLFEKKQARKVKKVNI